MFLINNNHNISQRVKVPWTSILKSMPVWAIVVGNLAGDFGFYIFETCQPTYLKEVLKFDITRVSIRGFTQGHTSAPILYTLAHLVKHGV